MKNVRATTQVQFWFFQLERERQSAATDRERPQHGDRSRLRQPDGDQTMRAVVAPAL